MSEFSLRHIWRRVRLGGELRPLVCLAASAAALALLAGIAVATAFGVGMLRPPRPGSAFAGDVRGADVIKGLSIAGGIWLLMLIWLWRPAVRLRRHSRGASAGERWAVPLLVTVAAGAGVTLVSSYVGKQPWDARATLTTAIWLVGGGFVLIGWLPAIFHMERGRPVLGPDGRVNLHCPDCGYAMAGLHTATCPECGRKFTLDELIRAQDYEGQRRGGS